MITIVIRVPAATATSEHIVAVCDNHYAAGYRLASAVTVGADVVLIFQPK